MPRPKSAPPPDDEPESQPVVEGPEEPEVPLGPEPEPDPPPPPDPEKRDPAVVVGLLNGGEPEYVKNPSETRERQIRIGPQLYDHVKDDADGVWLYRPVS